MQPRLCVLIPVFNNQAGLMRTLRSLAAVASVLDVLVVDDGSSPPIRIAPNVSGSHRVIVKRLEHNGGITRALNSGLQTVYEGGYTYIGRVDAGDTVRPDRFEKQLHVLNADPDCGLVGSLIDFVDMNGKTIFIFRAPETHERIVRRMQVENCIIHSGVTMRAAVVRQTGGYRERCLASEDYDLFRRMLVVCKSTILPEPYTRCEYNLAGLSISKRGKQQRRRLKLQCKYFQAGDWMSYFGVARTCLAMLVPHAVVLAIKRVGWGTGEARIEDPLIG